MEKGWVVRNAGGQDRGIVSDLVSSTTWNCPVFFWTRPDTLIGQGWPLKAVIGGFGRWQGPRRGRGALRREGTNTEASTDDYPTTQCPVVRWCFLTLSWKKRKLTIGQDKWDLCARTRFLGKGVRDVHWRGGRGRYFDNFTFKVLEMGFEQCRYLKLGEPGAWEAGTGGWRSSEKASISAKGCSYQSCKILNRGYFLLAEK